MQILKFYKIQKLYINCLFFAFSSLPLVKGLFCKYFANLQKLSPAPFSQEQNNVQVIPHTLSYERKKEGDIMPKADPSIICKNIFKDGKNTTSKDKFTRAWIGLINQLEKRKKYNGSPESQTVNNNQ